MDARAAYNGETTAAEEKISRPEKKTFAAEIFRDAEEVTPRFAGGPRYASSASTASAQCSSAAASSFCNSP